jgi:hypothetical protein
VVLVEPAADADSAFSVGVLAGFASRIFVVVLVEPAADADSAF